VVFQAVFLSFLSHAQRCVEFGALGNVVLFHVVTCEQPPIGYVRVSIVIWFWGRLPHVVKRIYPSRSTEEELEQAEQAKQAKQAERAAKQAERAAERGAEWQRAWDAQFARLQAYKVVHGDCNVPQHWVEDQPLASWVCNLRISKKKFDRNGSGSMTAARVGRLTALGFAWAPDDILWDAQFARLRAYKVVHGDCNVPHLWAEDQPLANWVGNLRTSKKKFDRNGSGLMTAARVGRLTALGFVWALRGLKRKVWSTLCKQPPVV
jgi:hypothetical protein